MLVKDITTFLEQIAPKSYQESYDNCGLLIGSYNTEVTGVIITLDVTEAVLDEAIKHGSNLIVAHHPLIFGGLKRINGDHWVEKCVIKAIKHDLAIYAIHTNLDSVSHGVNGKIADVLGLGNRSILSPKKDTLVKLTTFAPHADKDSVLKALFDAGAGTIGNYDECSFQLEGKGTFKPVAGANPTIGEIDKQETVEETRIEVVLPNHLQGHVLASLKKAHSYEEVAYYLTPLSNLNQKVGSGLVGSLPSPIKTIDFLASLKKKMKTDVVRHTEIINETILKVAVCGGSGRFLLNNAIASDADIFITADFKYHDFFEADNRILVADIGHYESEQFTKDLLYDILRENFANIALRLSEVHTNPIKYL
ncbi:MAG: dinuclear metal center YbgI/SA1388 family protein [Marinoscillum sp.]|jgi:dinuclear metal center YbgI/SA1388 family protein